MADMAGRDIVVFTIGFDDQQQARKEAAARQQATAPAGRQYRRML